MAVSFLLLSPQPIHAAILIALMPGISIPLVGFTDSSPAKLWEVRLSENLIEPAGWTAPKGHRVIELAFSPDGRKIAVTMDLHNQANTKANIRKTHLLIVDVQDPHVPFRQFDLETCGNHITWSPDAGALLVCGRILRLDDGGSCDLSQVRYHGDLDSESFWLSADRVILFNRTITDLSCRPVDTWTIAGNWDVADTIPEKGSILLREFVKRSFTNGRTFSLPDYVMADRDSHRLTSGPLVQAAAWSNSTMMASGAGAVCSALVSEGHSALHCWKLPGGEVIRDLARVLDVIQRIRVEHVEVCALARRDRAHIIQASCVSVSATGGRGSVGTPGDVRWRPYSLNQ